MRGWSNISNIKSKLQRSIVSLAGGFHKVSIAGMSFLANIEQKWPRARVCHNTIHELCKDFSIRSVNVVGNILTTQVLRKE